MSVLFSDTKPKIEALQIAIIRRMPAWKKIAMVISLNETVITLAISGIQEGTRRNFPCGIHRGTLCCAIRVDAVHAR